MDNQTDLNYFLRRKVVAKKGANDSIIFRLSQMRAARSGI
jgi:hypothetical protein